MFPNSGDNKKNSRRYLAWHRQLIGENQYTTSSLGLRQSLIDGFLLPVQYIVHAWAPLFSGAEHL
jgi:hypothetical protein